jgi:hypothetical protein
MELEIVPFNPLPSSFLRGGKEGGREGGREGRTEARKEGTKEGRKGGEVRGEGRGYYRTSPIYIGTTYVERGCRMQHIYGGVVSMRVEQSVQHEVQGRTAVLTLK